MQLLHFRIIGIALLLLSGILGYSQESFQEKELKTSLRLIGHQLLLKAGDSTSRVMPIVDDSNVYKLSFENDFALHPDELISIVDSVMKLRKFVDAYVVEIKSCGQEEVLYSYAVSGRDENNLISCKGRALPTACYTILFTLKKSIEFSAEQETLKAEQNDKSNRSWFLLLILLGFSLMLMALFARKKLKKKETSTLISLGKYDFDQQRAELILAKQRIELSHKESDLLYLLYRSLNQTLEREHILQEVWGDEGDYVGRTLDVFISKLRKKLEGDEKIRIVNIRGVGYKLQLDL